jgi:hypothetical protein
MLGLDQHYGKDVTTQYVTSYQTKGSLPTAEFLGMMRQIHDKLLEEDPTRTYKDVVNKFMHKIVRCKPKPKEQCVFAISGGKISYNSKTVKGCSVNRVYLSDLKKDDEKTKEKEGAREQEEPSTDSWTFDSLMKRYGRYVRIFGYVEVTCIKTHLFFYT